MRDEQWDVFWSQVYWLAAIALAALPLLCGIWVDAQGAGWLRALEEHYREWVAYTMLLTAIAAAESLLAAQMAWRHGSVVPIAAAVIFIGSFLLLMIELFGFFMMIDRIPIYAFPLIIGWGFFAKTTAALERSGWRFTGAA
jgi:uncharacterized protein YacL